MKKNTYPGKFIVFEGLDGSGQSTQADLLADFLQEKAQRKSFGHTGVAVTKEPTSSLIGGLIRGQLNHDWKSTPECLQMLFAADRLYHIEKEIIPLLERGITVICDRYFYTTIAYGTVDIKDSEWLTQINKKVLLPDIVFLLKVSPKVCIQRIATNRHGFTLFEQEEMLEKIWKNYVPLTRKYKNMNIINGEQPPDKVAKDIQTILIKKLS